MARYNYTRQPYIPPKECRYRDRTGKCPVTIVGAGPVGLTAAIDLALHGVPSIVLDQKDQVSRGSRAICWSKRTLEIFDRLGVAARMVNKGVTWKVGRLFHGKEEIFSFNLLPEPGHKMPAFINLQQYYLEEYLIDRAREFAGLIDLRFQHKVLSLSFEEEADKSPCLEIDTPDGSYRLMSDYVLACDGAHSLIRRQLGLALEGEDFDEKFLIADVEMTADFPSERWFWFHPDFHAGETALLHKQPDDIYRIDLQLGPTADPDAERQPDKVSPRIARAVGGRPFKLDWVSVYRFSCRALHEFQHGRVLFVGDSAHVVSPFGARGGNGGIQDVDNLAWKLAAILNKKAGSALLSSYSQERRFAALENIRSASQASSFMSPALGVKNSSGQDICEGPAPRFLRDETLNLAKTMGFARRLINSGRLSTPCRLGNMPLITPVADTDDPPFLMPGDPCLDAPLADGSSLLDHLSGGFQVLSFSCPGLEKSDLPEDVGLLSCPAQGQLKERYGQGVYLVRPDQHIAGWWSNADPLAIKEAHNRALGS